MKSPDYNTKQAGEREEVLDLIRLILPCKDPTSEKPNYHGVRYFPESKDNQDTRYYVFEKVS